MNQFLQMIILATIFSTLLLGIYLAIVLEHFNFILFPLGCILLIISSYLFFMYRKYGRLYTIVEDDTQFIIPEYSHKNKFLTLSIFDQFESGKQAKFCTMLSIILILGLIALVIMHYLILFIKSKIKIQAHI